MLEHEKFAAASAIASRGFAQIDSIGVGELNELNKSFLLKRMEIDFMSIPDLQTNDATASIHAPLMLVMFRSSGAAAIDTVAESLDARFDDIQAHQTIIWRRKFLENPSIIDDADNVIDLSKANTFKTSKSFSKGFRLDKDEVYLWGIFNPTTVSLDITASRWLTVRYWGVYLE